MATARVSQGDSDVVDEGIAELRASQYSLDVIFNIPAELANVSAFDADVLTESPSIPIQVSSFDADVVMRGKVYNPKIRAWPFDLDGHEFWVLRLGDGKTLVYDLTTESWSWWSSADLPYWRPTIGTNWTNAGSIPFGYGSNVVVGDDTFGTIAILNPLKGLDDSMRDGAESYTFPRQVSAQVLTRGRVNIPCFQVYLVGDVGHPAYTGASVTLSYSDDGGNTFTSAGSQVVEAGNYYQEIVWRSLGLVRSPGRIFRITDDGAFPQIDELTIYDGNTAPE